MADYLSLALGVVPPLLQLQACFGPKTFQSGQEDIPEVIDSWRPQHISSTLNRHSCGCIGLEQCREEALEEKSDAPGGAYGDLIILNLCEAS